MEKPMVYEAIRQVQQAIGLLGIEKDRQTESGARFWFRGIDQVLNAMNPIYSKCNLVILPRMISRVTSERETKAGAWINYVALHAEFDLVCTVDGSKHTITTFGEAMDSGDKATNKAMSIAYKYAVIQAFAIPVIGTDDPDESIPEGGPVKDSKGKDPEPSNLAPNLLAQALEDISCADSNEALKKAFATAWTAAAGDKAARSEIDKAYRSHPKYIMAPVTAGGGK